jgi:hypothetical protein
MFTPQLYAILQNRQYLKCSTELWDYWWIMHFKGFGWGQSLTDVLSWHLLDFSQHSQCPGQDSNAALPKYKSRVLPLPWSIWCHICRKIFVIINLLQKGKISVVVKLTTAKVVMGYLWIYWEISVQLHWIIWLSFNDKQENNSPYYLMNSHCSLRQWVPTSHLPRLWGGLWDNSQNHGFVSHLPKSTKEMLNLLLV